MARLAKVRQWSKQERCRFTLRHDPDNQTKRKEGNLKGRQSRGNERVMAGVRQEARGAWWQGAGLGGAALTGPRGPCAAGPYGEQWKGEEQREPQADKPLLPLLQLFPWSPRDLGIRYTQQRQCMQDNTHIQSGHQWKECIHLGSNKDWGGGNGPEHQVLQACLKAAEALEEKL